MVEHDGWYTYLLQGFTNFGYYSLIKMIVSLLWFIIVCDDDKCMTMLCARLQRFAIRISIRPSYRLKSFSGKWNTKENKSIWVTRDIGNCVTTTAEESY